MPKNLIAEATPAAVGETTERGTVPIVIASPGWGSSGWYSPKVLENAVEAKVFGKSLHMYVNHPSESERHDRPERDVRDLVGTLSEDATWDPQRGIVGEATIFGPYRELFRDKDFVEAIGVSLRAFADTTVGEAEGRKGTIITDLIEAQSVDFVTKAGRGGKVIAALESVRDSGATETVEACTEMAQSLVEAGKASGPLDSLAVSIAELQRDSNARTRYEAFMRSSEDDDLTPALYKCLHENFVSHGIDVSWETRRGQEAQNAIGAAASAAIRAIAKEFKDDESMRERRAEAFVPSNQTQSPADLGTFDLDGFIASFNATEASRPPKNAPVTPAGQSQATESEEIPMATTPIEESRLAQLEADAGRATTAESERDTANTERDTAQRERNEAREALAQRDRVDAARDVIATQAREAGVTFTPLEERGLLTNLPATESGVLDEDAYTTSVKEAAAEKASESGAGRMTGFGSTHTTSDSDVVREAETAAAGAFGRTLKEA